MWEGGALSVMALLLLSSMQNPEDKKQANMREAMNKPILEFLNKLKQLIQAILLLL